MSNLGTLRPVEESEVEMMRLWRNAPAVRMYMYSTHEISREEHLAWWDRIRERTDCRYFIYEAGRQPLGVVGITQINQQNRNASWAFYAAPGAPRGTGSRMELMALDYAFSELHLNKLCCEVLATNQAVISLHQKFGFKVEGVLREQHRTENGFIDVYRFGILKHEWANIRPSVLARLIKKQDGNHA